MTSYQTVFDAVADPDRIQPDYWLCLVGGLMAVILAGLLLVLCRRWRSWGWWTRTRYVIATAGMPLLILSIPLSISNDLRVRAMVRSGHYESVEGCLRGFSAGGGKTSEVWVVGSEAFAYRREEGPGYHTVESEGGFVHPDTRVRVAYVQRPHSNEKVIVRLEVQQRACEPAADARYLFPPYTS